MCNKQQFVPVPDMDGKWKLARFNTLTGKYITMEQECGSQSDMEQRAKELNEQNEADMQIAEKIADKNSNNFQI